MSLSGIILLIAALALATHPRIGILGAWGLLLPFEANALITGSTNVITADFYLLLLIAAASFRVIKAGRLTTSAFELGCVAIIVIGLLTTAISPRLFEGGFPVLPLASVGSDIGLAARITTVPLAPSNSNYSQLAYLIIHFLGLAALISLVKRGEGPKLVVAMDIAAVTNIAAMLASLLFGSIFTEIFSTASYRILADSETALGLNRAIGGFREAARQGQFSITVFAYYAVAYFLKGGMSRAIIAGLSLLCAGLSMSLTAASGLAIASTLGTFLFWSAAQDQDSQKRPFVTRVLIVALAFSLSATALLLTPAGSRLVDLGMIALRELTVTKFESDSGIERLLLLKTSLSVMFETYGFGCGLGCTRGNGLWFVMLANLGLLGTVLIAYVLYRTALPRRSEIIGGHLDSKSWPALSAFVTILFCVSLSQTVPNIGYFLVFVSALCWAARRNYLTP